MTDPPEQHIFGRSRRSISSVLVIPGALNLTQRVWWTEQGLMLWKYGCYLTFPSFTSVVNDKMIISFYLTRTSKQGTEADYETRDPLELIGWHGPTRNQGQRRLPSSTTTLYLFSICRRHHLIRHCRKSCHFANLELRLESYLVLARNAIWSCFDLFYLM